MSLLEQQNFMARLFTDEDLRREFLKNPENTAQKNNLDENDIAQLKQLLPAELNFFADSLFHKRCHEVEKLLPLTRKSLQKEFQNYFREFSKDFQPKSVKKHLEDAIGFTKFLSKKTFEKDWIKDLVRYEQARLNFNGYHKRFILKSFKFNVRDVISENPLKRKTFAIWLRVGKIVKHFII